MTAEKEVAPKVAYVADNVVELIYEVYPLRRHEGGRGEEDT